jgi:hypothetical protein
MAQPICPAVETTNATRSVPLYFARHHGFAIEACNVARGNEKGFGERAFPLCLILVTQIQRLTSRA